MNSPAAMRKDYQLQSLSEESVYPDPIQQFKKWWDEAVDASINEVNAMVLATVTGDGLAAARVVLLKAFDESGFVFFSNYDSNKGVQLQKNASACLVFFWKELERQVRITGMVSRTSAEESDAYFNSRPEGSRIGAWASPQSQVIKDRQWIEENEKQFRLKFEQEKLSRPAHWGGYRVKHHVIEFWQGRPNRLHDRIQYKFINDKWIIERLAP
jgi:pyridoxamine 5'-phosphate oxidase